MSVRISIHTRHIERNRLAAHLTATLSYLWVKALFNMTLGMLMGASLFAGSRTTHARPGPRAIGGSFRVTSLQA